MRHVIVVGTYAPFEDDPGDAEIWGVNRAYLRQKNLSRLYFLDPPEHIEGRLPEFFAECNRLAGEGCRLIGQRPHPALPTMEAYPLRDVTGFFGIPWTDDMLEMAGRCYFTSTIAYMVAHAISENVERITMHRINAQWGANDYFAQKACLDFWLGVAMGRGIEVLVSEDSQLGKPVPWESGLYGYVLQNDGAQIVNMTVAAAIRSSLSRIRIEFTPATAFNEAAE